MSSSSLEAAILKTLGKVQELEQQVQDFSPASQETLYEQLNGYVECLQSLKTCASESTTELPVELLELVDKGTNPDLFTVHRFEDCIRANQTVKGKVAIMSEFHAQLVQEAAKHFPMEIQAYQKQLKETEARRAQEAALMDPGL